MLRRDLLTSRVRVFRERETPNERAEAVKSYAPVGMAWVALRDAERKFRDTGAGEAAAGSGVARADKLAEIEATDVLQVLAGDLKGSVWRVGPVQVVGDERRFPVEAYTDPLPRE